MDKQLPDDFDPYEVCDEMTHERVVGEVAAGAGTVGSWVLVGVSLSQVNQILTAISLIAATCASLAAFVYYRQKR